MSVFSGSCVSESPKQKEDDGLAKRLNQVNEILEDIDRCPSAFVGFCLSSVYSGIKEELSKKYVCRDLIENSDIAIPLMLKRLDKKHLPDIPDEKLTIYFVVFEKTKSVEAIPHIVDYLSSLGEKRDNWSFNQSFMGAIWAAQEITSFELAENKYDWVKLYDQRLDIAKKLRQWYEEYKKQPPPDSTDPG